MSMGIILLLATSFLLFIGLGQRALDRLRLSDRTALIIVATMVVATFLIPNIPLGDRIFINIGGAIIPLSLVVYLIVKADTYKEKIRAIIAALVTGAAIYFAGKFLPSEPESFFMDLNILYGIIGGSIAYILSRSRRSAFIAGVMGVIISDLIQLIINLYIGNPAPIIFGGAGAFDATVISGILAVLLAEIIGEIRERLQGKEKEQDIDFKGSQFTSMLGKQKPEEQRKDEEE